MKNTIFALAAGILMFVGLIGCDKDDDTLLNETPQAIESYVSTHFPDNAIIKTFEDNDNGILSYDVLLEGNINLEFNEAYEITDIDGGVSKLPDSVIPDKLLAYVAENYPENFITDWELDAGNQQIELDNNVELVFDMAGEFLRIDD